MSTDLFSKLLQLRQAARAAKDAAEVAETELASFCADNEAELAEIRKILPGGDQKPKRTRSDKGTTRGPRDKAA